MNAFKNILLGLNVIQLGLFVVVSIVCLLMLDFNAEKEDFWGLILLAFISLLSGTISFSNLSTFLGWFKKRLLILNPGNFVATLLYSLVGMVGLADSSNVSREMLLAFIPALIFLPSGIVLKVLEHRLSTHT